MTTEQKIPEHAKISIAHAKLTGHIHQVIDHPSTTEIIKITKRGCLSTFPVNKAIYMWTKTSSQLTLGHRVMSSSMSARIPLSLMMAMSASSQSWFG